MQFEKLRHRLALQLTPLSLIAGVAFSFLGCCAAGRILSERNCFISFVRFHQYISPESLYYPTPNQVAALARSTLDPNKIIVVVGGSSVLHGTGQREAEVWTKALQKELGAEYQVINLALRCGSCFEFGGAAAEMLSRDFPKLIYVADFHWMVEPDGDKYRYFVWEADSKRLLDDNEMRQEWKRNSCEERRQDGSFLDFQRRLNLDSALFFRDFWSRFEYSVATTIYVPQSGKQFAARRSRFDPDLGAAIPPSLRYPPIGSELNEEVLRVVRNDGCLDGIALSGESDRPRSPAAVCAARLHDLNAWADICFPDPFRQRTIQIVSHHNPYYVKQLTLAEQTQVGIAIATLVKRLEMVGFQSMEVGRDYSIDDFYDRCHLSEDGGRRLAAEVAPQVRALAERLGYAR
jgi:hypothetical protein